MIKKIDNGFTWKWGNTFQENLDKIIILFLYLISSLKEKEFSKIDNSKDIDIYKQKLRSLREKGYLNQCSFGIEDFYSKLLSQVLDNNKTKFTLNEKSKIFADFEIIAKIHVQDRIKVMKNYLLIGLLPIVAITFYILMPKTINSFFYAFAFSVVGSEFFYFVINYLFVYIGIIKNPKTRYNFSSVDLKYCFDELNRLIDNLDSYFDSTNNNNVILIEQKLQAVLVTFKQQIFQNQIVTLESGDNQLDKMTEFNKKIEGIQASLTEISNNIKIIQYINEKPRILNEMYHDGLINFKDNKYCVFGSLTELLELVLSGGKYKFPREFIYLNVNKPDGTQYSKESYGKAYTDVLSVIKEAENNLKLKSLYKKDK